MRSGVNDPYRKFKFRIKIDGQVVAALTKCSALKATVESQDFRAGDHPSFKQKLPGQVSYDAITLEKGMTADPVFQDWAGALSNFVGNQGTDQEKDLENFRKDIEIAIYNLDNSKVKSYRVLNCWVSSYTAVPDLDATSSDVLIESLELQNEGIQTVAA